MRKLQRLKSKILIASLCLIFAFAYLPIISLRDFTVEAYAPTAITITNGDFDTFSGSSFPKTVSNWTSSTSSSSVGDSKIGVISTTATDFTENQEAYGLGNIPEYEDENVFMINNLTTSRKIGYVSNSITLDKDSYYIISIDIATSLPIYMDEASQNISSVASIYLAGNEINADLTNVTTYGNWNTYSFYVKTNQFTSEEVKLEAWIGSKFAGSAGAILVDKATAHKFDATEFERRLSSVNYTDNNCKVVDMKISDANLLTNNEFNDESGWTVKVNDESDLSGLAYGVINFADYIPEENYRVPNPGSNNKYNNTSALLINNSTPAGVTYTSEDITIKKQTYKTISVYVKTGEFSNGGAKVSLVPKNEDLSAVSFENIVEKATANSATNNWTKYTFYILGNPYNDEIINLELSVGNVEGNEETDLITGYAFFDSIESYSISYNDYTTVTTDAHNKQLDLSGAKSSPEISNGYFNYADSSFEGTYPLAPASWTITNAENTNSGIINTQKTDFNSKTNEYYGNLAWENVGYTPLQFSQDENANNNLLMIRNVNDYQAYKSSSYSMSSESYYKVMVDVRTLSSDNAYINLTADNNSTIARYSINSNTQWTTLTTYVATGLGSKSLTIELGLNTADALGTGYAFFDNCRVSSIDKEAFESAIASTTTKVVDFNQDKFDILLDSEDGMYTTSANWEATLTDEIAVDAGVIVGNENILGITSTEANGTQKLAYRLPYSIDSAKFYKFTFTVKTTNLAGLQNSGMEIGFSESTSKFTKIVDTDWTEYTFYICGGTITSLTPYISLISENATTTNEVYLKSLVLSEMTESEFKEATEDYDEENHDAHILLLGNKQEETEPETEEPTTTTNNAGQNWLLVPSIITALAILIALFGVIAKKTKFKKINIKRKANYDRVKTLHPAVIQREVEDIRRERLNALEEKIKANKQALEEYEASYKERLEKAKEEKQKQAEFKAYAKGRKKLAKEQEQLLSEKEHISSEEFANEQEEKIMKQHQKDLENEVASNETIETTETVEAPETTETEVEVVVEPEEQTEVEVEIDNEIKDDIVE